MSAARDVPYSKLTGHNHPASLGFLEGVHLRRQSKRHYLARTRDADINYPLKPMATGIEIAGVVLGAIPLIIEGIKIYREAAGRTTREGYPGPLRNFPVELETEQTILRSTYNRILCDIKATEGPDMNMEIWKEGSTLQQRVYERLGSSADSFKATAQNMDAVIQELMGKLGLSLGGKVSQPKALLLAN